MGIRWGIFALMAALPVSAASSSEVTFNRDVLPILQKNCQACHRPGEPAPMSFLTYQQVRPWAKAIREAVLLKKMPPWFADPHYGKFSNDRSLSETAINTLVAWADGGAPEGDPKDLPRPVQFVDGWNIGQPDLIVEMPNEFQVPASGTIEYQYIVIPTGFTEDRWVERAEVRPGNRAVVHHVIAFLRPPGSKWMKDAKPGVPFVPKKKAEKRREDGSLDAGDSGDGEFGSELLVGYAPGLQHQALKPGQAKLVKAGTDFVFQMHYTANGKAGTDRSWIGLVYSKEPPVERVVTLAAGNSKFVIPPGASNHRVDSKFTLHDDAMLIGLMPHMHLRGKSFDFRLVYPTGETETPLVVPRYDFNWQLFYYPEKPLLLPKGTRIECTAHFDNSPNNAGNPDPTEEVRWGDQSWEEMMIGWFDVAIDARKDPKSLFKEKKKPASSDD